MQKLMGFLWSSLRGPRGLGLHAVLLKRNIDAVTLLLIPKTHAQAVPKRSPSDRRHNAHPADVEVTEESFWILIRNLIFCSSNLHGKQCTARVTVTDSTPYSVPLSLPTHTNITLSQSDMQFSPSSLTSPPPPVRIASIRGAASLLPTVLPHGILALPGNSAHYPYVIVYE